MDKDREAWESLDPITRRVLAGFNGRYHAAMRIVFGVLIFLSVASFAGGVLTYRLIAENNRQEAELQRQAHAVVQQNVSARYADCVAGDGIRAALYQQAVSSARQTAVLLDLVPSLDTPLVRRIVADSRRRQLVAFKPRGVDGCRVYAMRAVPPRERDLYRVP